MFICSERVLTKCIESPDRRTVIDSVFFASISIHSQPDQRQNCADHDCVRHEGLHSSGFLGGGAEVGGAEFWPGEHPVKRPKVDSRNLTERLRLNGNAKLSPELAAFATCLSEIPDRGLTPRGKIYLGCGGKAVQVSEKFVHAKTLPAGIFYVNTRRLFTYGYL